MHVLVGAIPTYETFILCSTPAFASGTFAQVCFCGERRLARKWLPSFCAALPGRIANSLASSLSALCGVAANYSRGLKSAASLARRVRSLRSFIAQIKSSMLNPLRK